MNKLPYWVSPARVRYDPERKERVVVFTVAKSRKDRRNGVEVEITKVKAMLAKMPAWQLCAKLALEAAQAQGWAPKPVEPEKEPECALLV